MVLAIGAGWFLLVALDPESPPSAIIASFHASMPAGTHLDTAFLTVATTQSRFLMRTPGADRIVLHRFINCWRSSNGARRDF